MALSCIQGEIGLFSLSLHAQNSAETLADAGSSPSMFLLYTIILFISCCSMSKLLTLLERQGVKHENQKTVKRGTKYKG